MGKFLLLGLLCLSSFAAASERVVLEYRYGNQITSRKLQIFENGKAARQDLSCCPPSSQDVEVAALTEFELGDLVDHIEWAVGEISTVSKGEITADGSNSGFLTVHPKTEKAFFVHAIERGQGMPGEARDKVTFRVGPSSRWIESFVRERFKLAMPMPH
jgi:hypothetical protein